MLVALTLVDVVLCVLMIKNYDLMMEEIPRKKIKGVREEGLSFEMQLRKYVRRMISLK